MQTRFEGEFSQFRDTAFQIATQHAERACLELALLLRYLDDEDQIGDKYMGYSQVDFGSFTKPDGAVEPLALRDVTNKIIHARAFSWDMSRDLHPRLICYPRDGQRWKQADIDITALAAVSGSLLG